MKTTYADLLSGKSYSGLPQEFKKICEFFGQKEKGGYLENIIIEFNQSGSALGFTVSARIPGNHYQNSSKKRKRRR